MKQWNKGWLYLGVLWVLAGCAVVPKVAEEDYATCTTTTRQLNLDMLRADHMPNLPSCNSDEECLVILAGVAAVPVATGIVSGSVVAVNNTVHWVEYQGRCSDSELRRALSAVNDALFAAGGMVLATGQQMWEWLTAWVPDMEESAEPTP